MNKYYQKMIINLIEDVYMNQVRKPADNLSDREYSSYLGSMDFLIKLRNEVKKRK